MLSKQSKKRRVVRADGRIVNGPQEALWSYATASTRSGSVGAFDRASSGAMLGWMGDEDAHRFGEHGDPAETDQIGKDRDRSADDRDQRAEAQDQASEARDDRAEARDDRAETRERAGDGVDRGAAADRAGAMRDRSAGASDRTQAAEDRKAATTDRAASARERAASFIDELTGVHRRDAGMAELEREIAKAKRTVHPVVLAFVDVDDLKGTNDSFGHAAGDKLLCETANSIRSHLRSYDLIIRFGGDEFLCALVGLTTAEAAERFSLVKADLAAKQQASITVGFAELEAGDALQDLIARADEAMYGQRQ